MLLKPGGKNELGLQKELNKPGSTASNRDKQEKGGGKGWVREARAGSRRQDKECRFHSTYVQMEDAGEFEIISGICSVTKHLIELKN